MKTSIALRWVVLPVVLLAAVSTRAWDAEGHRIVASLGLSALPATGNEAPERLAREQYNLVRPGEEAYSVLPAPLPALELPDVWPFGPLSGPADDQK